MIFVSYMRQKPWIEIGHKIQKPSYIGSWDHTKCRKRKPDVGKFSTLSSNGIIYLTPVGGNSFSKIYT